MTILEKLKNLYKGYDNDYYPAETLKDLVEEAIRTIEEKDNEIDELKIVNQALGDEIDRLNKTISELEDDLDRSNDDIRRLKNDISDLEYHISMNE